MAASYRIIVVEDEPALAELLERLILRRYPTATVETYWRGQDGLDAHERRGADLLLVDHGLPDTDGLTVTHTLRARGDAVPIIGMSGDPSYHGEYLLAGATAFISGQDVFEQVLGLIERLLAEPPG